MSNYSDNHWIKGCAEWIQEEIAHGWTPYYLNFMFEPLRGSATTIIKQMHDAIHKEFYTKFLTRFVRHPHRQREQESMPRLMLFPDRPVWKHKKATLKEVTFNDDGLHFNGPMLIPSVSRFKGCPIEHINEHQARFTSKRIARIDIKAIDERIFGIADYSGKTVKRHRADDDDILLLPKSISEVKGTPILCDSERRAIKDIQSSRNVSEEVARQLFYEQGAKAAGRRRGH